MRDVQQPILAMTRLVDLQVHVGRSGLAIGDQALVHLLPEGRIGVYAPVQRFRLGLLPYRPLRLLGLLRDADASLIAPALAAQEPFRVRVVGLTPEYLGPDPAIDVSIWGDPKRLLIPPPMSVA